MDSVDRVSFADFRQACRAYRPSELLPHLARTSAKMFGVGELDVQVLRTTSPWNFAVTARECLLWGNEHRSRPIDGRTVPRLFNLLRDVVHYESDPSVAEIVSPLLYDQFVFQGNPIRDMNRAIAVFDSPEPDAPRYDWSRVFGMSLPEMIRATTLLMFWTSKSGGRIDLDGLWTPEMDTELAPRDQVEQALRYLTRTPEEHRDHARSAGVFEQSTVQYAYNPLRTAPFVDFGSGIGIVAPEPRLVRHAISLSNLYYVGPTYFGEKAFHTELGDLVENYVGRQLQLVTGARVLGEQSLNAQNAKSIDWFFVLPELIVLVECKSARLNSRALAGDVSQIRAAVARYVVKARSQIDTTAAAISADNSQIHGIPSDGRPVLGLIVTAEPIHLANSGLPEYGEHGATPTMVISLSELEALATLPLDRVGSILLDIVRDPERRSWAFAQAAGPDAEWGKNNILDEAGKQSAFFRGDN